MFKKCLLTITVLLSFMATPCSAQELKFLFTRDQNVRTEDFEGIIKGIHSKKDISNDDWFSSPPTRLELITYTLNQHFKKLFEELWEFPLERQVAACFEKRKDAVPIQTNASAYFIREEDIFVCNVNISFLGKPKKPMRDVIKEIISSITLRFSGEGYYFQNTILHSFMFGSYDDPEILKIVELLRNNLIVFVTLDSSYGNEKNGQAKDYYILRGYKSLQEDEIHYSKESHTIGR